MSDKFIFNKDFILLDELIFKKGDVVDLDNGKISFKSIDGIDVTLTYYKIKDYLDLLPSNLIELNYDDTVIKTYRIQIDVNTTEKKAKEIEVILRNKIDEFNFDFFNKENI